MATVNNTIEAFAEELQKAIAERIDAEVTISHVTKNNGLSFTGLTIRESDTNVAPNIYLERFFEDYGRVTDELVSEILEVYNSNKVPDVDVTFFKNWEEIKNMVHMRLVNLERNNERLQKMPHLIFGDLAIYFYVEVFSEESIGRGTISITNEHLEIWDKTTSDLYEAAMLNKETPMCGNIFDVLMGMMSMEQLAAEYDGEIPETKAMFVCSNKSKTHGSIVMADNEFLNEFAAKMGSFFILPSSIHEVILLPLSEETDKEYLDLMVKEVNSSEVSEEEVLSDHAYYFDASSGKLLDDINGNEMTIEVA